MPAHTRRIVPLPPGATDSFFFFCHRPRPTRRPPTLGGSSLAVSHKEKDVSGRRGASNTVRTAAQTQQPHSRRPALTGRGAHKKKNKKNAPLAEEGTYSNVIAFSLTRCIGGTAPQPSSAQYRDDHSI